MESSGSIDLDRLGKELSDKMRAKDQSLRPAAEEIGCSPATLGRLLKGSQAVNVPDTKNLIRAVSWLEKSLSDFELNRTPTKTSLTDVEVHLRALSGISDSDKQALVAMVRAAHDAFRTAKR